jgi:hypothetical protein
MIFVPFCGNDFSREMLGLRRGIDPVAVFLVIDFDGFVWNHLTCSAYRAINSAHGACPHGFTEFDLQPRVAPWADTLEQDVMFQRNLPTLDLDILFATAVASPSN